MAAFPSLPKELASNPEMVALHRDMAIDAINSTIKMSEIRCASFDELLKRVEHLWDDPSADQIVYRLCHDERFSENQYYALAESIRRLADEVDRLPSAKKPSPDRAIRRLLANMPAKVAAPIAESWLEHPRKFRREVAYRVLRECGLIAESGPRLWEVFNRNRDQECLRLLARFPAALSHIDVASVLPEIEEAYWRMRLLQGALISDKTTGMKLADSYPSEFLHAIGRLKDKTVLPRLRELFELHRQDLQFISLYAWVLGQLNARDDLIKLKAYVGSLRVP